MLLLSALFWTSGCLGPRLDNGKRLTEPPWKEGFEKAAGASPEWVIEILNTVAELEAQLESGD